MKDYMFDVIIYSMGELFYFIAAITTYFSLQQVTNINDGNSLQKNIDRIAAEDMFVGFKKMMKIVIN